jgi:hypothetical protein
MRKLSEDPPPRQPPLPDSVKPLPVRDFGSHPGFLRCRQSANGELRTRIFGWFPGQVAEIVEFVADVPKRAFAGLKRLRKTAKGGRLVRAIVLRGLKPSLNLNQFAARPKRLRKKVKQSAKAAIKLGRG